MAETDCAQSQDNPKRKKRLSRSEQKKLKRRRKSQPESEEPKGGEDAAKKEDQRTKEQAAVAEDITDEEYLKYYVPTPLPKEDESSKSKNSDAKMLGSWFPNAVVIKSKAAHNGIKDNTQKSSLVLFYQYATPKFTSADVHRLVRYLTAVANARELGGRIRVAPEGLNATVSAMRARNLRWFARDLRNFAPRVFRDTDFKYVDSLPADRHFKELKLLPVKELVFYGISEKDAPLGEGGVHLDAKEYHKMLERKDAVVIDVRNHYEAVLGRFDGQQQRSEKKAEQKSEAEDSKTEAGEQSSDKDGEEKGSLGAAYLDPKMRKSTDFPDWLAKSDTQQNLEGKTVLMYCTGGVRCERASAYLKQKMGDKVQGVYQLKGGIERYLKEFPDGGHWRGKNFVFDKREAVGVGAMEGDGGVVRKKKKQQVDPDAPTKCCVCSAPWDRYIGKKKCYTCGVPVLMCDACMSLKPDRTPGKELSVRCPLCVEQGVTVPAADVEYTDNGVRVQETQNASGKAASSVLKWGGGTAAKKKQQRKAKRRLCQFGEECIRKDCMFAHPEREKAGKKAQKV